MLDGPLPVAVVCHDAGAANFLIAELTHIQAAPGCVLPVMEGPARRLWEAAGAPFGPPQPLDAALARAQAVVSGTGWASNLEHQARVKARERRLPSAAVIDHWVNYVERFERDGSTVLPDEIWVYDADAKRIANAQFPGWPVRLRTNHFLADQVEAILNAPGPQAGRLLVLLEPIRYSWPHLAQPGEFEALDFLAAYLHLLQPGLQMHLRPHPSDPPGKYDAWIAAHSGAALDTSKSLAQAIAASEWVAGCETAALPVALSAGRRAVSTLPPGAPPCRLPQSGLMHLRNLPGTHWPVAGQHPPAP